MSDGGHEAATTTADTGATQPRHPAGAADAARVLDDLRRSTPDMLDALERLVVAESPSSDTAACAACVDEVAALGRRMLGHDAQILETDGRVHLRWRLGVPRLLVLGHLDTVWPVGTLARMPFSVSGGVVRGPGVFDMKAGIVQAVFAIARLPDPTGVEILLTSDEEIGSPTSRPLIEASARAAEAVLVVEPSSDGALKTGRKGVSMYRLVVSGRASHAGLEPEAGANALVELSHQVIALADLAEPQLGTTVTPTVASAGTTTNTVPAEASVHVDVRAVTAEEQERVDGRIRARSTRLDGTTLRVEGGPNRPPFPPACSRALFERATRAAAALGLQAPRGEVVGGGSDGNFTAGVGAPTLDGLGAVGAGAHAVDEHVVVDAMAERAALLAVLVADLLRAPVDGARRAEQG